MSIKDDLKDIIEYVIVAYDLEYDLTSAGPGDYLFRWCDFLKRYVPQKERETLFTNGFWNNLTKEKKSLVHYFCNKVEYGEDLNPYQSKGLCKDGLSSHKKTDLLYADWGILHFHLTQASIPTGSYFSPRSDTLLFAILSTDPKTGEESFRCLDVCSHNERNLWSQPRLIKKIVHTWPELMDPFICSTVPSYNHTHNSATTKAFRNAHINSTIVIDGIEYAPPNLGITSAGTALKVTTDVIRIKHLLSHIESQLTQPANLRLSVSGLVLIDSSGVSLNISGLSDLNNAIYPSWSKSFINGITLSATNKPPFWV